MQRTNTFYGPMPEQLIPAEQRARGRHLAHLGMILKAYCNVYKFFESHPEQAHQAALEVLQNFTEQYRQLTDGQKNQVADLIIKSISSCDIFTIIYMIGYASSIMIDGVEHETFPIRAANAIAARFNDSDYWFWQSANTQRKREVFSNMHAQAIQESKRREKEFAGAHPAAHVKKQHSVKRGVSAPLLRRKR